MFADCDAILWRPYKLLRGAAFVHSGRRTMFAERNLSDLLLNYAEKAPWQGRTRKPNQSYLAGSDLAPRRR